MSATPPPGKRLVTPLQIKAIHAARNALGMNDDEYRDLLKRYKATSSKDLTSLQASRLLTNLRGRLQGGPPQPAPRPIPQGGKVIAIITPNQQALINHLVAEIAWREVDGFSRWLHRFFHLDRVATQQQASRVIEGLKRLKEHGHGLQTHHHAD